FVMCLALALVIGAGSSLSLALPDIATATGANQTQLTWVVNAYALVFAALLLPVGIAADRFGRRSALLLGLALFAAASFTSGLVDDPGGLIALRGVAGVGAAAVMPATLSVLVDAYPEDEQSRAVSVWAGVSGAGALVGILAAGVLLDQFWWGSVQVVYGVAAGLTVIACAAVVPPSNNPDLALDVPGGLLSLGGLAGIVFAVIEGPERGWTSAPVVVGALAGGALLALFVWHELRTHEPMLDVRLFTSPFLATGSLIVFLQFFAAFGFFFLAPQWLQYVHRLDSLETALWLLPVAVGIGPASAAGPALLEKLGPGRLAGLGMALMAMATGALAAQAGGGQALWVFAATLIVFGFGFGLAITPGTTLIIGGLPDDRRTLSAAVNDVTREVGGALGGAVAASVLIAVYAQDLSTGLADSRIPASAEQTAEDGVAQALAISGDLGRDGAQLMSTAVEAFANGYGTALWVATSALLVGAAASVLGARRKTHPTKVARYPAAGQVPCRPTQTREGSQPLSPR
ncbi:MAG: MFS transporter, partial [Nocardioides sp.]|nr:MFS transporter [Nocardioides sp.]